VRSRRNNTAWQQAQGLGLITKFVVQGLREAYERHHRCVYEPAALDAAVRLSARYIADRQLPDKARPPQVS
jgi:AAA lid domain